MIRDVFPRSRSLCANRCSHLISSFLACSCSPLGKSSRPWRFNSSRIQSFPGLWADLPEVPIGRATGGTWLAAVTFLTMLAGITMWWALKFLRQIDSQEEPWCNSPCVVVDAMEAHSWRPHAGSVSIWTHIQCPWMSVLPWIFMVPNGGMVTLCVVQTCPWMSSRWNFLVTVVSGAVEGVTPSVGPPSPWASVGQLEQPRYDCTKVGLPPDHSCPSYFPFCDIPISLSIILDPTITGTFLE